jgi:hypothetical protein
MLQEKHELNIFAQRAKFDLKKKLLQIFLHLNQMANCTLISDGCAEKTILYFT